MSTSKKNGGKTAAPAEATTDKSTVIPAATTEATPPVKQTRLQLLDEQLKELQVEEARLRVEKARADKDTSALDARAKLDLTRTQLRTAEFDLAKKERDLARERASADENLTYTFYDGVTDESIKPSLAKLGEWNRRFPGKPITVIVNSPGGSVLAGLALYDFLQKLRGDGHHVTIICVGMAASMGGILLQAGDKRLIGANARVLIHAVSGGTTGTVHAMEDRVGFSRSLWESLKNILAARSVLSAEEIEERAHRKDWWLSAQEAIDLGFADDMLSAPPFAGAKPAGKKSAAKATAKPAGKKSGEKTGRKSRSSKNK